MILSMFLVIFNRRKLQYLHEFSSMYNIVYTIGIVKFQYEHSFYSRRLIVQLRVYHFATYDTTYYTHDKLIIEDEV
jgi:hypothetical protein